jgi:hypothetical protein
VEWDDCETVFFILVKIMNTKTEVIEKYTQVFRELINNRIRPDDAVIREVLRLSKEEDYAFLCVSMDIVEDACEAIHSFQKFGLNGPTKYDDVGEKYLRLYGILSATYIQQEALIKLCQLMNVPPSLKKIRELVGGLLIRSLRHKLCSHGTNYYDKKSDSIQAYVPIRVDLNDFNCTFAKNGRGNQETINLEKALDEHLDMVIELLDKILEKSIETLFKGQETSKNFLRFSEKFDDLRILRNGGFVQQLPDGTKIIVTMTQK